MGFSTRTSWLQWFNSQHFFGSSGELGATRQVGAGTLATKWQNSHHAEKMHFVDANLNCQTLNGLFWCGCRNSHLNLCRLEYSAQRKPLNLLETTSYSISILVPQCTGSRSTRLQGIRAVSQQATWMLWLRHWRLARYTDTSTSFGKFQNESIFITTFFLTINLTFFFSFDNDLFPPL